MFGRLSVGDIRRLSEPDNGILGPESQASFDAVKAEWSRDFAERIRPALNAMMPKVDTSALVAPPALRESMERIQKNLAAQLDFSKTLGVRATAPAWDFDTPIIEPVRPSVVPTTTFADDFEDQVIANADHLVTLQTIANVVTAQSQATARGVVFYVVVGLATTLGGVGSVVGMDEWSDRLWAIGMTLGLGLLAFMGYVAVRAQQKRRGTSDG